MIKAVLFDLDGTLLPMDQDVFINTYFNELTKKMITHGCDPELLIKWVWAGTEAMVKNDSGKTNREVFFEVFEEFSGLEVEVYEPIFDRFYREEFDSVRSILGSMFGQKEIIDKLRKKNYRIVLATSPVFPLTAAETRLNWIGLKKEDFDHITSYENCHYCKPNSKYYQEIFEIIGCKPQECLMIGNNVRDDMSAAKLGSETFLLTDFLEKTNSEYAGLYRKGSVDDLKTLLDQLPVFK